MRNIGAGRDATFSTCHSETRRRIHCELRAKIVGEDLQTTLRDGETKSLSTAAKLAKLASRQKSRFATTIALKLRKARLMPVDQKITLYLRESSEVSLVEFVTTRSTRVPRRDWLLVT